MADDRDRFIALPTIALVGASRDRGWYGNIVVRENGIRAVHDACILVELGRADGR